MKAAILTDGKYVSAHFGRCPSITLVETDGERVLKKEVIDNPGHHPGFLPQFLHERGVHCIIAGGMGAQAQTLFDEHGIRTVLGAAETVDEITGRGRNCRQRYRRFMRRHADGR